MKVLYVFGLLILTINAAPNDKTRAVGCQPATCKLPECLCSSTITPENLDPSTIPQLVYFTFDDAVTAANFDYYQQAFFGKVNPDGCPVGVTYFASHEYTDYSKVHALHAQGHEIALHSITHTSMTSYWLNITLPQIKQEFDGERTIIANFADIPITDIKGIRLPLLQLSGDTSFEMIKDIGLEYDCSWPTLKTDPGLWPYSLDYQSIQDCPIGPCPNAPLPGVWVAPMLDWVDTQGFPCSFVDACAYIPTDEDGLLNFMITNFNRQYTGNRAPFGFFLHAAWFLKGSAYFPAYLRFIDYLQQLNDVYIVSVSRALEWVRNPSTLGNLLTSWPTCQHSYQPTCNPLFCELKKGEEFRYTNVCTASCPTVYPWLGNPFGL